MEAHELTAQQLRAAIYYDPNTGVFIWRHRDDAPAAWNGKHAGKPAGWEDEDGYTHIRLHRRSYLAHRLAWLYMTESWPNVGVDHIDTNPRNNAWSNLRLATKSQNGMNRGPNRNNKSGSKGVSFCKNRQKWQAHIYISGRSVSLGRFETKEEAADAYARAAKQHYGDFARA